MVDAQKRRITMAWYWYVVDWYTEAAKTYKTLNNKNYAWCWSVYGGCCCMEWNGGKMEYKACFRLFIFLGRIFSILYWSVFPSFYHFFVCCVHLYMYTFSRFLMCKRHTRARTHETIAQCMASHKQKC